MHDEMKPQMPVDDSEASMARAELYRAAKNSMKLFEMIHEGQELEGWVSAKITKAADYLDSVYHYMEYQVKFGEGGSATSLDDITSDAEVAVKGEVSEEDDEQEMKESYEQKLQALLEGAMKKVKGKKADDKKEEKMDEAKFQASGVRATDKKKGKVEKSLRKAYFIKFEKEGRTKGVTMVADEGESLGDLKDRARRENMGWSLVSVREKEGVEESKDVDAKKAEEEKRKKEEKKKKIAKIMDEGSTGDYSAKKAAAGKDIGKPGKNFEKIAKKAEKGGAKSGEAVAGAVLKKLRAKEDVQVEAKKAKPDFLDVDKDGNKKEPMKKAVADKKKEVKESAELSDILKLAGRKPLVG